MPLYRMQATHQDVDELSKDRYVNTVFVYRPLPADDAAYLAAAQAFQGFWSNIAQYPTVAGGALASYMSDQSNGVGHIKFYDMADPKIRPIKYDFAFDVQYGAGTRALPNEVALCVTFNANPVAGVRPQSTRGRIYVGPFNDSALANDTEAGGQSRPRAQLVDDMTKAAASLCNNLVGANWQLVIASEARSFFYPVTGIAVDNAWDTQRRRGLAPTVRQKRTVPTLAPGAGGTSGPF